MTTPAEKLKLRALKRLDELEQKVDWLPEADRALLRDLVKRIEQIETAAWDYIEATKDEHGLGAKCLRKLERGTIHCSACTAQLRLGLILARSIGDVAHKDAEKP